LRDSFEDDADVKKDSKKLRRVDRNKICRI